MKHIILMSIFSFLFGNQLTQNNAVKLLSSDEFKSHIENTEVQLIDVRTPDEYNSGHITNAKNIDFFSKDFGAEFQKLDKSKPVYIYCKSGNRSSKAAIKLVAYGFAEIYDLEDGYFNYKK